MTRAADVADKIAEVGLVPVVRTKTSDQARRASEALVDGGALVVEITMSVPEAPALIRELRAYFGERAVIGAGTVLGVDQARQCVEAGAEFLVAPGLEASVVGYASEHDLAMLPGALTPTEVMQAWASGATVVKVFPCSALGGAKYLKALKGPLPHVKLLPTGGVTLLNVADYLAAGAVALGVGGELVDLRALEAGRAQEIAEKASAFLAAIRAARSTPST